MNKERTHKIFASDPFGFRKLTVYQKAFELAGEVNSLSGKFPKEEIYGLTSQVRRSSKSVCANIGEGYRKRMYPSHFKSKMTDADMEITKHRSRVISLSPVSTSTKKNKKNF